jgi:hypothetical protein
MVKRMYAALLVALIVGAHGVQANPVARFFSRVNQKYGIRTRDYVMAGTIGVLLERCSYYREGWRQAELSCIGKLIDRAQKHNELWKDTGKQIFGEKPAK